ncbi:MAG: hypothetical protein LBU34_04075 [Planctomycetaceae bacterium]|jgi:hypothetical protein|nr:hypothetical protein [Planctomycetaceae bacterium]
MKKRLFFILVVIIFVIIIIGLFRFFYIPVPLPFYGYINYYPKFEDCLWKEMTIVCYIHTDTKHQEAECSVNIIGAQVKNVHKKFTTKSSKTYPFGTKYQSVLILESSSKYSFRFLSPDTLHFSKVGNSDTASFVHLKDDKFYSAIRHYCFEELHKKYPNLKETNIRLCERYTDSENITPYIPE